MERKLLFLSYCFGRFSCNAFVSVSKKSTTCFLAKLGDTCGAWGYAQNGERIQIPDELGQRSGRLAQPVTSGHDEAASLPHFLEEGESFVPI